MGAWLWPVMTYIGFKKKKIKLLFYGFIERKK